MLQGNYYTSSLSRTLNPAPDFSSVHNHHSKRERIERIFAYLPCSQAYEYYAIYSKCEFFSFPVYVVHTLCYNPARPDQQRIIVELNGYPVVVPFVVMENEGWFLKTAYYSRKEKGRF